MRANVRAAEALHFNAASIGGIVFNAKTQRRKDAKGKKERI
jgi:hypothetical protein